MASNWPPKDWLEFSRAHHRAQGRMNLYLAGGWGAMQLAGLWSWAWIPALAFLVVAYDHGRDAHRVDQKLRELYP